MVGTMLVKCMDWAGFWRIAAICAAFSVAAPVAMAQQRVEVTGAIEWGVWIDPDGCMHWWSDGLEEGYMVTRLHPKTGKPYCLRQNTCLVEASDTLFATNSARLTSPARQRLAEFFARDNSFSYAIYGHTDSRGSDRQNLRLSERRAEAVAAIARQNGSVVDRLAGLGESQPIVPNSSAANMQKNRRVEVVCYRLPE